MTTQHCRAQFTHWNGNKTFWSAAHGWTAGVPTPALYAGIGVGIDVEDESVFLDTNSTILGLQIGNGMTLWTQGFNLQTTGPTYIVSSGPGGNPTTVQLQGGTLTTEDLDVEFGSRLNMSNNAILIINETLWVYPDAGVSERGSLSGSGLISLTSDEAVALDNGGVIRPSMDGLTISQIGSGLIDLDGASGGPGTLDLRSTNIGAQGRHLTIFGTQLADDFSGTILSRDNSTLLVDLTQGWTADANSKIIFHGNDETIQSGRISGSHFTLAGELYVLPNPQDASPADTVIESNTQIAETAVVAIEDESLLEFNGETMVSGGIFELEEDAMLQFHGPTTVQDGHFDLLESAILNFNGPVEVQGGQFTTLSTQSTDGRVSFNSNTTWNGNVQFDGFARQIGTATVTGPTSISGNGFSFDMDGFGATIWNINNNLVFGADAVDPIDNAFDGTFNIGTGTSARLIVDLQDSDSDWTMSGEMNVQNTFPFEQTRLDGSPMRLTGALNVNGANVRFQADTVFSDSSTTTFESTSSSLVMRGNTTIEGNATFVGEGTMNNHPEGRMMLADGASLNEAALSNRGLFEIGVSAGIGDTASFNQSANGHWLVEIGGHAAGDEHDQLLVGGGEVDLDGRLIVKLTDVGGGLFTPQIGDEFTILSTVIPLNGQFVDHPLSIAGGNGYQWEVLYNSNDITLRLDSILPDTFLGDINGDGNVSLLDVQPFVDGLIDGEYNVYADMNCDGVVDLLDVQLFVDLLTG